MYLGIGLAIELTGINGLLASVTASVTSKFNI